MKQRHILQDFYRWLGAMALTAFFLLPIDLANAQTRITGKIIDSATSKPLADASVYIANSTIGTKTDKNGEYSFNQLTPGNYELIASCLGYQARQVAFTAKSGESIVNITLNARSIELKEVTINAKDDWKHNLSLFKREFIGTSNAQECSILNPEMLNLDFDYKNNRLLASTDDFLEIENSTLGYKLRFLVKDFWADYNTRKCHYSGSVIFEELPGKKSDQKRWAKNRLDAYSGSFRHFLTSLAANNLKKDKFTIKILTRVPNTKRPADSLIKLKTKLFSAKLKAGEKHAGDSLSKWNDLGKLPKIAEELEIAPITGSALFTASSLPGIYNLQFPGYIYVIYKNKTVNLDIDDLFRFKEASDYQISAFSLKNADKPTIFNNEGLLLTKESLYYEGAWNSRIVNLLPFDYVPAQK